MSEERAANDVLDALERDFDLLPEAGAGAHPDVPRRPDHQRTGSSPNVRGSAVAVPAGADPGLPPLVRLCDLNTAPRDRSPQWAAEQTGGWRTLDRGDHGLLSGGAKVVTLMQPFIAALHAMYDQAESGPRMLWLDEAFGGVDATNKASMFRLLASCDLDWLIAGPGIIANSAAVPLAAIYEVRRAPQPLPGVSLELAVWTGNELTHVLTPDPADLRDVAATEEPADDTLFSDL